MRKKFGEVLWPGFTNSDEIYIIIMQGANGCGKEVRNEEDGES